MKKGYSMVELTVVLAIFGIISSFAILNKNELDSPSDNSSKRVISFLKKFRSKAVSTSKSYKVQLSDQDTLNVSLSDQCDSATWENVNEIFKVTKGSYFENDSLEICFKPSGMVNESKEILIKENDTNKTKSVNIYLGGAIK